VQDIIVQHYSVVRRGTVNQQRNGQSNKGFGMLFDIRGYHSQFKYMLIWEYSRDDDVVLPILL